MKQNRFHFIIFHFIFPIRYLEFQTQFAIYTFVQTGKRLRIAPECPFGKIIEECWAQVYLQIFKKILKAFFFHFRTQKIDQLLRISLT